MYVVVHTYKHIADMRICVAGWYHTTVHASEENGLGLCLNHAI